MDTTKTSPIIKPKSPSGTIPIGNKNIDINSGTVPSSAPPEPDVIKNKLNVAIKKNIFKRLEDHESINDK